MRLIQTLLFCVPLLNLSAQTLFIDSVQLELRQLKGVYSPTSKIWTAVYTNERTPNILRRYQSDYIKNRVGVLKLDLEWLNEPKKPKYQAQGLVDTAGNILLPCVYNKVSYYDFAGEHSEYFGVEWSRPRQSGSSLQSLSGLAHKSSQIVFEYPGLDAWDYVPLRPSICPYKFIYIDKGLPVKRGFINLDPQNPLVTALAYEEILNYGEVVVFRTGTQYDTLHLPCAPLENGVLSSPLKFITGRQPQPTDWLSLRTIDNNPSKFLIQKIDGSWMLSQDLRLGAEYGLAAYKGDIILEYDKGQMIIRQGEFVGLKNEKAELILPAQYEDIYFMGRFLL